MTMKIRTCLLATIALSVFSTAVIADSPFDKFIPRGRLLKRLRDDIVGPPEPKQPTPAKKPAQKGPTPAVRPTGQQAAAGQQRPQAANPAAAKRSTVVASGADGFGMAVVVDKKEQIIVAQVLPGGNAAKVGLVRGDVIVEAGGVELTAIEEFQEIAKMLGAGDQLDLKIARRGRESEVLLQYGQPPSLEDVQDENGSAAPARTAASGQRKPYGGDFSFVPPADNDSRPGMRSVVEQPIVPARPASTQLRAIGQLQSNSLPTPPQQLQQTVTQQQQQIQTLQSQLERLRRQQGVTGSGVRRQRGTR